MGEFGRQIGSGLRRLGAALSRVRVQPLEWGKPRRATFLFSLGLSACLFSGILLLAQREDRVAEASSEPGLAEETAPVVRPRPRNSPRVEARVVLHGRVLDPDGRPIPRALVSASSRRGLEESHGGATPSWRDPDSLYSEETLTDARGRFQLSLVPSRWYPLAVFAPSGRREKFPRFFVDPSKGVDDLELRLAPATRLLLDLRDDEGSPLPRSRHFPSRGLAAGSTLPRVQILAELVGGERLSTLAAVGGHDLYSAQFYCPREDIVAVTVEAPGFEPRRLELDPTPRGDEERLQLELTPR